MKTKITGLEKGFVKNRSGGGYWDLQK